MKKIPETGIYPFWFWNGQIKEEEILRQLELIRNSGCRGAVIHARKGNKIPYLSERWFGLMMKTVIPAEMPAAKFRHCILK